MALLDHDRDEFRWRRPRRPARTLHPIDAFFARLSPGNDNRFVVDLTCDPACELDCLIGVLPTQLLQDAAARAHDIGIGADRVLIAWGAIDEADYLRRFAWHTSIAIADLSRIRRDDITLHDHDLTFAARNGLFPMRDGDDLVFVIAPRGIAARRLNLLIRDYPDLRPRLRLAIAADLDAFLLHQAGDALAHDASFGLRDMRPALSAAPRRLSHRGRARLTRAAITAALAGLVALPTSFGIDLWSQMLALWFVAAIIMRLAAALVPQRQPPTSPRMPDAELPVYTIIVALYHEARSVPRLLRALNALDYPREKLDILLAVEADDGETRAAIARFGPMPQMRVLVAPDVAPRTKPKALNCALPFARGSFIAVFDAEDRPDPGQLRAALAAFRNETDDVACAQASLVIDNVSDSLFTRMFAAEYAGQFDAVLPGLAAMKLPLPLGGTSNHFRAEALRSIGGWDAWNVTEDADLGLRLARFGHRAITFSSTTQEEAPITFLRWLRQRSRWMKGWMQTLSVHMREPSQLWRDAGWRGFVTLNLIIAGPVVSALAYPVMLCGLVIQALQGGRWLLNGLLTPVHFTAILAGIAATATIGLIGLHRHGRLRDGWILLLTPIYWGCLSIATWRALWQLLREPYRWEKTEHGLSKRRRLNESIVPRAQRGTSEAR